jgi:uncharacterized protein YndB with AHSA1/START domain
MNTSDKTPSSPKGFKLTVTRVIQAPVDMVFRAWTEPEQLRHWFSPVDVECRSLSADIKTGGSFRIHMVSKKGDHIATGKYLEIIPNQRLQFSWTWESYAMPDSVVTIDLEDLGASTRLTLRHEGLPDREDAEQHTEGWTSIVEKCVSLLETHKATV